MLCDDVFWVSQWQLWHVWSCIKMPTNFANGYFLKHGLIISMQVLYILIYCGFFLKKCRYWSLNSLLCIKFYFAAMCKKESSLVKIGLISLTKCIWFFGFFLRMWKYDDEWLQTWASNYRDTSISRCVDGKQEQTILCFHGRQLFTKQTPKHRKTD